MKASFGAMCPEATRPWEPYVPHEQAPWNLFINLGACSRGVRIRVH